MTNKRKKIIVGLSGASGVAYGVRLLEMLAAQNIERHLIMSRAAKITLGYETDFKVADVEKLADHVYSADDIGAALFQWVGQNTRHVDCALLIKTMSEIATGVTANLLTRAADVTLKERRRLVLMVRETPLHTGHLRTMTALSEMGAIIAPPVPALYAKPENISQMIDHTLGRLLDLFDLDSPEVHRWKS